jgi:hypothetical protein
VLDAFMIDGLGRIDLRRDEREHPDPGDAGPADEGLGRIEAAGCQDQAPEYWTAPLKMASP